MSTAPQATSAGTPLEITLTDEQCERVAALLSLACQHPKAVTS